MKIVKVWKDDYPWDVRVEKVSKALIAGGHEVHLVCSNKEKQEALENIDGIVVHRFRAFGNDRLNTLFSIPFFLNPFWVCKIIEVVKKERADLILVRDLPLVIASLLVGKLFKIPVVFDMAENYPSMWREHVDKRDAKFINHILKNPAVATVMEDYVVNKVAHLIVVVEESMERILRKGVPRERISIVSNTPEMALYEEEPVNMDDRFKGRFKLLYVGSINGGRGLDTAIKAVPALKENISNLCLIIAGEGEYLEELKKLARDLGVEQYVAFLGWVDSSLVPSYISRSDVCIVPHIATEFINSTIPNKLFDYMACKKPVIVSDAAPLKRIVTEADCGMVFRSGDAEDFAEKVLCLKDESLRQEKGSNGFLKIRSKYNWENDANRLREIVAGFRP